MVTPDPDRAAPQCAHDELDGILLDHGVEPTTAVLLTRAIAEWAKTQDEDWPWDDGSPAPEPTDWSTHPSITDPGWLAARAQEHAIWTQDYLRRLFRGPGNPQAFIRRDPIPDYRIPAMLHPDTHALAALWAREAPLPERWQPSVCIPAGTALSRYGVTLTVDPTIPRDTLRITTCPRPLFHITWRTP